MSVKNKQEATTAGKHEQVIDKNRPITKQG